MEERERERMIAFSVVGRCVDILTAEKLTLEAMV